MMQVGARQLFKKIYIYMLLTWRGTRIRLQSGLRRRVTLACSEWALVCRAEDQDFSAHTKHPDPCKPELACFGQALVLLQIETEQPEEILLQLCQLSIFKHSGPLKSCVSVGSPHLKDPQRAGHSQHGRKNAFSVYQLCQDWSHHCIFCHCRVLCIKVEGRTSQRKEPKCVIANLTVYLIH